MRNDVAYRATELRKMSKSKSTDNASPTKSAERQNGLQTTWTSALNVATWASYTRRGTLCNTEVLATESPTSSKIVVGSKIVTHCSSRRRHRRQINIWKVAGELAIDLSNKNVSSLTLITPLNGQLIMQQPSSTNWWPTVQDWYMVSMERIH